MGLPADGSCFISISCWKSSSWSLRRVGVDEFISLSTYYDACCVSSRLMDVCSSCILSSKVVSKLQMDCWLRGRYVGLSIKAGQDRSAISFVIWLRLSNFYAFSFSMSSSIGGSMNSKKDVGLWMLKSCIANIMLLSAGWGLQFNNYNIYALSVNLYLIKTLLWVEYHVFINSI